MQDKENAIQTMKYVKYVKYTSTTVSAFKCLILLFSLCHINNAVYCWANTVQY